MRFLSGGFLFLTVLLGHGDDLALRRFLEEEILKTSSAGVCVVPLEEDEVAMEWQADTALIPASTMKVVTTATALQVLGPEFVFETRGYLKGENLVVKGGGDPTLGATSLTGDFEGWVNDLKKAGVTEVRDVIGDDTFFEEQRAPNEWPWGDVGNYYGAGPSGLNYHLNAFEVSFTPGRVGGPAELAGVWPRPPGVEFVNLMKTGSAGSGDQGYIYGGPGAKVMSFRGTVPTGGKFRIRGGLPDPALSCVTELKAFLEKNGIAVLGEARVAKVELGELIPIFTQKSPSLLKIVNGTNQRSVNLYADSIFKALTASGSTEAAVAKVRSHWKKQGMDLDGFVMHDGSGLSPRGTVTARQLATILKKTRSHETGDDFANSLPVSGKTGTMRGFGNGTDLVGNLQAKSGSMTRVRSYAGYFTGKSGRKFAFAVIVNNALGSPKGAMTRFLEQAVREL